MMKPKYNTFRRFTVITLTVSLLVIIGILSFRHWKKSIAEDNIKLKADLELAIKRIEQIPEPIWDTQFLSNIAHEISSDLIIWGNENPSKIRIGYQIKPMGPFYIYDLRHREYSYEE